jgi:predicted phosphodiesterase
MDTLEVLVLTDLHVEFAPFVPTAAGADVVVLAGDIGLGPKGLRWAATAFPQSRIVYVAGNHEHYGHALPKLTDELQDEARPTSGVRPGQTTATPLPR